MRLIDADVLVKDLLEQIPLAESLRRGIHREWKPRRQRKLFFAKG